MNELITSLKQFLLGLRLWITVAPWEQAVRVRLGKHTKLLETGVHFKIPLLDMIYLQSVRMRITTLNRQTIATQDGKIIILVGTVGYSIQDTLKLYQTLHHAEDSIVQIAQAAIADFIGSRTLEDCTFLQIKSSVEKSLQSLTQFGLHPHITIYITEFAVTRTYRIVGDYAYGTWGKKLDTNSLYNRAEPS